MLRVSLAKYFTDCRHWLRRHRRAKLRRPACDAAACLEWLEDRQLLAGDAAFGAAFRTGASGYDIGDGAVADAAGNVYVLGAFTGTVDFDPGPATVSRAGDAFVAKYGPAGNLIWVRTLVGDFGYQGGDLAFDATHNVYVTGSFQGTVDFDPGASTFSLSSPSFRSVFVLKLNSLGDFQWAKKFGGTGDADCTGIAVDANDVYTTGAFAGTVDFDPGTSIQNRISAGSRDAFLAKLTTDGNFAWAQRFGSTEDDQGWSVATDSAGNVLATGHFMGTVDFDPGAGTTSLTSAGFEDVFVTKFNSSGGLLWTRQLGGPPTEEARGIAVDSAGSVYTTGRFFGDGDFDPGPGTQTLVSAGGDDVFVSKLDSDGNFVWADRFGGTAGDEGTGIAVDAGNTLFVTGVFQNQADFDPGAGTFNLTSAGSTDVFVAQLNRQTGAYLWAGSFAGSGEDRSADIAVDTVGGVYTTGYFRNTTDFDPGAGTFNLTSAGDADVFVSRLTYDTGIPHVTINRAVDQPDPTNETEIDFTVVFTEPVTGFMTGDVTLSSSTAPGTLVGTVTPVGGDGTTYLVTVTGMTNNGNVIASIPAGVAMDGDGNSNFASTSTDNVVLFDLGNPTGDFADPTNGGSMGAAVLNSRHYLDVTFTDPGGSGLDVTTIADAGSEFTLSGDAASGVTVNGTPQLVSGTTYRYSFTGAFGIGTVTFDFLAGSFFDLAGNPNVAGTGSFEAADLPTLVVTGGTVTEGNSGTVNLNFTVSLSYFTDQTVTVQYATADDTATAGKDYTAKTGTLTFAPGSAPKTVSVAVIGDVLDELDETVLLMLSNATNARLPAGPGEGMILDNDADAKVSINNATVTEGNSGTTNMTFTVSLSAVSGKTVQMNYATFDVTAQNGTDYQPTSGALTFAPGETTKTVTVVVNGDILDELNETFEVRLSDVTNAAVLDGTGVGTITDDDATPTLSINDVSIAEGDAGTANATFTVSLSAVSGRVVTVQYATANGTATAGSDYTARPLTTLTIPDGSLSVPVTVPVIGDTADEPDETFFVRLSSAVGATILDSSGTGTILDNDDPPTISINDVSLAEGNSGSKLANFTVSLSAASGRSVTVQYATANGTATAGSDYTSKTGTLTFAPGVTTQTIPVSVTGDLVVEPDETFVVNLSNPVNASLADGSATGTILNDDPTLTINDVTISEGTGATATAIFTVTLSAVSTQDVTVDYFTMDGSATGGSDYVSIPSDAPLTLTIPAGQKTRTLTVTVLGDTLDEANETFFVKLANAQNAIIGDDSGTGTITDTDSAPTLAINDIVVNEAAGNATFAVSLSTVSGQAVSVKYATANGTALAGSDYTAAVGTLTIPAGQPSGTITVPILNDLRDEFDENFRVTLSSAVNATTADSSGTGTILDDDDPPTVSINDVAVTEGNSGSLNATFTVSLSVASGKTITLAYATAPATEGDIATAGKDYTAKTGTLTFNPGVTSLPVTIAVLGDVMDEPDETFLVKLSNPNNVTIADDTGVGTIRDNDEPPTFSVNNVGVIEGNPGNDVTAIFTVSLSTASGRPITVNFNTSDNGSATEGVDYLAKTDTLTFDPGVTVQYVSVTTIGDFLDEPNETFLVNLSNPTNATILRGMGTGTITDNDPLPTLAINDLPNIMEGDAGTTDAVFTVTLTGETSQEVRINYSTANGTATAGADYTAVPLTTLVIPVGDHTATIRVPVRGDLIDEADETFFVKLATPINAQLQDNSGTGTIIDDDPSPTLSIDDVEIVEGNSGSKTATFTVRLSETSSRSVTVKYATANGSATAGSDYTAKTGTLTFAAGVTSLTIPVSITGDLVVEPDETFTVNLSSAVNADLADASGTGTILNDDPTLTINDVTVTEGSGSNVIANFTVSLSAASPDFVSVDFATANGTAVAGQDYTATSGTVTFNPGETKKTIPVTVLGDFVDEPNEYFFVQLSNANNAFIGDDTGKGTITDNDSPPTLTIDDVSVQEGDSGLTAAVFTVSLSAPSTQDIRVNYSTANGTATAGSDYEPIPLTTLVIGAGEEFATLMVLVHGDMISEADETFFLRLASPVNATIADSSGTGTIRDDEPRPTLSIDDVTVTEGNSSTKNATFTVRLSEASVRTVTVQYTTVDDTATTAGLDYTAKTGTLSFSPGVTSLTIPVSVRGDQMIEPDETFTVNLFNPTNADLADDSGTGTILNDDSAGITITPTSGLITTESGGTATFTVKLNTQPTSDVTLTLASDDTTEGTVSPTSLIFTSSNWNTARTVTVRGVDDSLIDGDIPYQIHVTSITTADPDYLALDPNSFVISSTNRDNDALGPGKVYVVVVGAGYVLDNKGQIDTSKGDNIATYAPDTFPILTAFDEFGNQAFLAEWSDGTSGASCFLINSQYANGLLLTVYIDGF